LDPGSNPQRESANGERRRRRRWPFVVGGLVALGLLVFTAGVVALVLTLGGGGRSAPSAVYYEEEYVSGTGPDKIAVVPVDGTIAAADRSTGDLQPTTTPEGLADAL
jgi:protease IV